MSHCAYSKCLWTKKTTKNLFKLWVYLLDLGANCMFPSNLPHSVKRKYDDISKVLPYELKCGSLLYCLGLFYSDIKPKIFRNRFPLRFDIKGFGYFLI